MADRVLIRGLGALCSVRPKPGEPAAKIPLPRGMNSRQARRLCRQSKLALGAADRAWEEAGLDGQDAHLLLALTHGSTSFLNEFHDYLVEYGPEAASPNAFAGGVANAPLAAISAHLGLTLGGATLVGYEACGLEALNMAARRVASAEAPRCLVGACEEFSPLVQEVYAGAGWYPDRAPPHLPCPRLPGDGGPGLAMAEGAAFLALEPDDREPGVRYRPLDDPRAFSGEVDIVISGAGGGPQDHHELELLQRLLANLPGKPALLFAKAALGETFAVGSLLSVDLAVRLLRGEDLPPAHPLHPRLAPLAGEPRQPSRVLIVAADRTGAVQAGLLSFDHHPI